MRKPVATAFTIADLLQTIASKVIQKRHLRSKRITHKTLMVMASNLHQWYSEVNAINRCQYFNLQLQYLK